MANKKISDLQENTNIQDGCCFPIVSDGETKKIKFATIKEKIDSLFGISLHTSNKSNPHSVTASQIGTYDKSEIDTKLNDVYTKTEIDSMNKYTNTTARNYLTGFQLGYSFANGELDNPQNPARAASGQFLDVSESHTLHVSSEFLETYMYGRDGFDADKNHLDLPDIGWQSGATLTLSEDVHYVRINIRRIDNAAMTETELQSATTNAFYVEHTEEIPITEYIETLETRIAALEAAQA